MQSYQLVLLKIVHFVVCFVLSQNHIHLFSMQLADLKPLSVHICNALHTAKNRYRCQNQPGPV
jgi:hypothetical protein